RALLGRLGVARLERLALRPPLVVLLAAPAGVDEVPIGALHRPEQLEPLEPVGRLDHPGPVGEALLQFLAPLLRHGEHVDLHNRHVRLLRLASPGVPSHGQLMVTPARPPGWWPALWIPSFVPAVAPRRRQ